MNIASAPAIRDDVELLLHGVRTTDEIKGRLREKYGPKVHNIAAEIDGGVATVAFRHADFPGEVFLVDHIMQRGPRIPC